MSLTKVTDAASEPLTLADAKTHLRETLSDATNDAYITSLIKIARQAAEDRSAQTLLQTTWLRTLDAFPCLIELERPPFISIDWIKYVDSAGALQTLASSEYQVDLSGTRARIAPAYGKSWPTRSQLAAVTVQYKSGYAAAGNIPTPIVHWIKLAIADMYNRRERSAEQPAVPQGFAEELLAMGNTVWSP
jgi:uncharacterized phiE125 gp8 family phage protein